MSIALIVAREVGMMLMITLLGAYTRKKDILTEDHAKRLSDFLITYIVPVLILGTLQREKIPGLMPGFWMTLLLSVTAFTGAALFFTLIFRRGENRKTARVAAVLPNCAFMGIPLLRAVTGEETLFFCGAMFGAFQLVVWCWAVPMLEGGGFSVKKSLLNRGVIAFAVGLALFLAEIRLPAMIISMLDQLTALNTPLSLIVLGVFLADIKPKGLVSSSLAVRVMLFRNLLFPLLFAFIIRVFNLHVLGGRDFALTFVILFSCPVAVSSMLLPVRAGEDGVFASKIVALSMLASLITLPLMTLAADMLYS